MGLTEAVLAICEDIIHHKVRSKYDNVDFEGHEYYSWLVDESNQMADYVFENIDKALDYYINENGLSCRPPEKDDNES